jgi:hypothetical protein
MKDNLAKQNCYGIRNADFIMRTKQSHTSSLFSSRVINMVIIVCFI